MELELQTVDGQKIVFDIYPSKIILMGYNETVKNYSTIDQAIDELLISKN
jgi:hypothetical protein